MSRYLLDTNILLGLIRGANWARDAFEKYELNNPENLVLISIVSQGEILALADKFQWAVEKRSILKKAILEFAIIDLKPKIVLHYAALSSWTEGKHPLSKPSFPEVPVPARKMGQNDLWIAATCMVTETTLITADKDFDHLHDKQLFSRILITPR